MLCMWADIYGEYYPDMLFLLMEAQAVGDGNEGGRERHFAGNII